MEIPTRKGAVARIGGSEMGNGNALEQVFKWMKRNSIKKCKQKQALSVVTFQTVSDCQ